jgi:glycosyltransferase involved in cell wall biosynthesis
MSSIHIVLCRERTLPQKIRVFHLCDKFGVRGARTHGVSRLFTWWFPRFDPSRFEPRLICIRPEDESSAHLRRHGLNPTCLGHGRFSPAVLTDLLALIRRERPGILHAHGFATSNYGRVAGAIAGVPTIVHEHAVFPSIPWYQVPADRALSSRTALGIAVSDSTREFMVHRRFIAREKIRVVFSGAPLDVFKPLPAERVRQERARLGVRLDEKVVGTVGRLDAQKGVTYFLKAAARVLSRKHDVRFLIAGDGHLLDEHREEARTLGIADRIVFAGFWDDVPAFQSLLDVQVFPSIYEGTPLTVFEAMSMSRPIVSTTVDGLGEVLRDRKNALLVSPRDDERLAAAVLEMLETPGLAARLAAQAELDSRGFDVRKTVDALQTIYEELLGRP